MNFEMAAEGRGGAGHQGAHRADHRRHRLLAVDDRDGRRGVAGNLLIFKVAGAACDPVCRSRPARRLRARPTPGPTPSGWPSNPVRCRRSGGRISNSGRTTWRSGIGIHGEPGVARERLRSADAIVDTAMDAIFKEMDAKPNERVAVLVNSFGGTPMMELYILYRRVEQRLSARGIVVEANWIGLLHLARHGRGVDYRHASRQRIVAAAEPAL